jgi:hypothetical protein
MAMLARIASLKKVWTSRLWSLIQVVASRTPDVIDLMTS